MVVHVKKSPASSKMENVQQHAGLMHLQFVTNLLAITCRRCFSRSIALSSVPESGMSYTQSSRVVLSSSVLGWPSSVTGMRTPTLKESSGCMSYVHILYPMSSCKEGQVSSGLCNSIPDPIPPGVGRRIPLWTRHNTPAAPAFTCPSLLFQLFACSCAVSYCKVHLVLHLCLPGQGKRRCLHRFRVPHGLVLSGVLAYMWCFMVAFLCSQGVLAVGWPHSAIHLAPRCHGLGWGSVRRQPWRPIACLGSLLVLRI